MNPFTALFHLAYDPEEADVSDTIYFAQKIADFDEKKRPIVIEENPGDLKVIIPKLHMVMEDMLQYLEDENEDVLEEMAYTLDDFYFGLVSMINCGVDDIDRELLDDLRKAIFLTAYTTLDGVERHVLQCKCKFPREDEHEVCKGYRYEPPPKLTN